MTDHNFAGLAAELETAKWNLMLTGDTAGLASILSDELYYVHSSGVQDNKKTYLEKVGNRTFIYRRLDNRTGPMPSLGENAFSVHGIAEVLSREARASDGSSMPLPHAKASFWRCHQEQRGHYRFLKARHGVFPVI